MIAALPPADRNLREVPFAVHFYDRRLRAVPANLGPYLSHIFIGVQRVDPYAAGHACLRRRPYKSVARVRAAAAAGRPAVLQAAVGGAARSRTPAGAPSTPPPAAAPARRGAAGAACCPRPAHRRRPQSPRSALLAPRVLSGHGHSPPGRRRCAPCRTAGVRDGDAPPFLPTPRGGAARPRGPAARAPCACPLAARPLHGAADAPQECGPGHPLHFAVVLGRDARAVEIEAPGNV